MEYTLTRSFRWPFFTPISYAGAGVAIVFLAVINVALTGYETITVFQSDFDATQSHWYDKFMPQRASKAGTLCDTHVFNTGDTFTTNYTMFEWTIESISKPNAGSSGVSYRGTTLTGCDVSSAYINGDLRSWTVDFTTVITCKDVDEFEVNAKTSFSVTSLPGKHSPLLGVIRTRPGSGQGDPRAVIADVLLQKGAEDIGKRVFSALVSSNYTTPVAVSLQVDFLPCPASLGADASCATSKPAYNISYTSAIFQDIRLLQNSLYEPISDDNPQIFNNDTLAPISNLIQLVYAATRLDLGNPSRNNFILNPNITDQTLNSSFPNTVNNPAGGPLNTSVSSMYEIWDQREQRLNEFLPIGLEGPANIQVVYLCRFQRRKSAGSLFISVLVATLSMFSSGWAIYMMVATYFAKRKDASANRCDSHSFDGPHAEVSGYHSPDYHLVKAGDPKESLKG
ncbi:hypothetical protein BDQ12DRAFT_680551 [Crucibulum laeve]|uniref:Transmembrane protein n=1 Tax=Crucibulum laeve TaxID=68775 RepID=A0A5C3MGE9_9AGAR|nr:hypothetical protein BDQ12DRAFT_680551 [Crucibulum laeve]